MRKQGSLDGIILLVISFSVINYVVSKSVRLRQADSLFFVPTGTKKREAFTPALRTAPKGLPGEDPRTPSGLRIRLQV